MGNSTANEEKLVIKILGGETESQELFDFHSSQKEELSSELTFPSSLGFENGFLAYSESGAQNEFEPIFKIEKASPRNIQIINIKSPEYITENCIWKVLADGEEMELEKGDCIKIGKTKIVFKDIVHSTQKTKMTSTKAFAPQDREETERMDITHEENLEAKACEGQCRICFDNLESERNPLLSLCKCAGSVKYIHFDCLKDWTQKNIKKDQSSNCLFYSYYEPNICELCHEPLHNEFKHNGQAYKLYEFEETQAPYAVFENHEFDSENQKTKVSVYKISLIENTKMTVGRHNNSQVVLRDISVSRTHCFLTYKSKGLYIQDKKSKFGTLVCPQRGFEFDVENGLALQYQSKVIKIVEESTFKGLQGCCSGNDNIYNIAINKTATN